jgi:hypothetical protein
MNSTLHDQGSDATPNRGNQQTLRVRLKKTKILMLEDAYQSKASF